VTNPLFRRRFNFTQPKRIVTTTSEPPLTTILDLSEQITTTTVKSIDEKLPPTTIGQDQDVDSSIYQEDKKFINSRYNQIGELSDIDDDAAEGLLTISKAPLPFSVPAGSTTSRYIATTGRQPEKITHKIQQQQTIPDYEYNSPIVTTTRRNSLLSTTPNSMIYTFSSLFFRKCINFLFFFVLICRTAHRQTPSKTNYFDNSSHIYNTTPRANISSIETTTV